MLTRPRALPPNGHIAILAASSPSQMAAMATAAAKIEARGYRVTLAPNIEHRHRGYLAGTDDERLAEVNRFLRSDEFDAFFFARGGYGLMRILEGIDFDAIARNPRPIVGFSDVTALHQAVAIRCNLGSFHGPMLYPDFCEGLSLEIDRWLWWMLAGEAPLTWQFGRENVLVDGDVEGVLFGGCLSLTTALAGTPFDFWPEEGIWFWEDVGEPIYRIDRMLTHLRLSGRMKKIRGVIIGKLKGCGSEQEVLEILRDFFGSFGIPIVDNLPFGHFGDNLLMPIGSPVRLSTSDLTLTITEPAVERRGNA